MELVFVSVSVTTLAFFITVVALVAIVFGQQRVVDQAIRALSETLKAIFKQERGNFLD
jgi:hypothetical protein